MNEQLNMKRIVYALLLFIAGCGLRESPKQDLMDEEDVIETPMMLSYSNDTIFGKYKWKSDSSVYYWNSIDWKDSTTENSLDTFTNQWFSHFMHKFELVNLSKKYLGHEIYRVTWLRTFHKPIVFQIEKDKSNVIFHYKISDGAGGYEFGKIIADTTFIIDIKNWSEFKELVSECDFWNLKTKSENLGGHDGSEVIMEGHHKNGYHMVYRWGGAQIGGCARYLIDLSKIQIPKNELY